MLKILENYLPNEALKIVELVQKHNRWRKKETLNMIASENVTSPLVDLIYMSDMMHRYAEGLPYKRFYQGNIYVDELEVYAGELIKELFNSKYADLRPISGTTANGAAFYALGARGDKALVTPVYAGSHVSHTKYGILGALGIEERELPFDSIEMNIDHEKAVKVIKKEKPKLVILGGTVYLFPHPVKEIVEAVDEVGGYVIYDAAHVLGLIAGKKFPNPLDEGAHIVTSSTHKTFPGPQGGLALTNIEKIYKAYKKVIFPVFVSNHHLHRLAATAITALEMKYFGEAYADQIIRNSKRLAESLHDNGFRVLGEKNGFTETHQVVLDVKEYGGGAKVAEKLERANIIVNKNMIPGDTPEMVKTPSGLRLGTQELTRWGMKESEMEYIAELFKRIIINEEPVNKIREEVKEFRANYLKIHYTFDVPVTDLTKYTENILPLIE